MIKATIRCSGVLSAAVLLATQAAAQTAPAAGDDSAQHAPAAVVPTAPDGDATASDTGQGDIVVTALRRNATVQSVPLSISAISGDTLSKTGASQLNDYFRQIPNVNVTAAQGGVNRVSIRGINAAGEAVVGVYYDETPVTGPSGTTQDSGGYAADLNLFDVQRVEVLRGPQGTLYGASSMAGTLRIIFNKPDYTKVDAAAEAQLSTVESGSTGYYLKGMVNAPLISDKLAVRLVGYYQQRPGWIDSTHFGTKNVDDSYNWGVRGLIGLKPDADTTLTATLLYQKSHADDMQGWFPSVGVYKTNSTARLPFQTETQLYNLTGERDLGFAKLTATGSWYKYQYLRAADFTAVATNFANSASACKQYFAQTAACTSAQMSTWTAYGLGLLPVIAYQPAFVRSQNYEVRLASGDEMPGWLQWTIGAFYEKRYDKIVSQGVSVDAATGAVTSPLRLLNSRFVETNERQVAGFGEVSVKPLDGLTLTAGARYYDYDKTTGGQVTQGHPILGSVANSYTASSTSANGWLEKFNVSYKIAPRVMVYATASKGFRPGGANNVPGLPAKLVAYQPDSVWNYEVGFKSSWLNNQVVFNASIFDVEWTSMQTSARTADGLFSFITNAGKARIRGFEAELTVQPIHGLTLNGAIGYSDAKLTEDQSTAALLVTTSTGKAGDRIPNSPDWTGSASAAYSWALNSKFNGLLQADFAYTGSMRSTFRTTDPFYVAYGDFGSVNLRAGIENDKMGLYIFCQNVGNTVGSTAVLSTTGITRLSYGIAPRTFGINARIRM